MQELVSEVELPEKKKKTLTRLLQSLNDVLTNLPEQKITDVSTVDFIDFGKKQKSIYLYLFLAEGLSSTNNSDSVLVSLCVR